MTGHKTRRLVFSHHVPYVYVNFKPQWQYNPALWLSNVIAVLKYFMVKFMICGVVLSSQLHVLSP